MTGLRTGTVALYISDWRQWARFCEIRGIEPWTHANRPGWNEHLLGYILRMREITPPPLVLIRSLVIFLASVTFIC